MREKYTISMGKSGLDEKELYENIIAAGRIAHSASMFMVPIQDVSGKIISFTPLGHQDLIFVEIFREILRRKFLRDAERSQSDRG